jgi:hypothetical protein
VQSSGVQFSVLVACRGRDARCDRCVNGMHARCRKHGPFQNLHWRSLAFQDLNDFVG